MTEGVLIALIALGGSLLNGYLYYRAHRAKKKDAVVAELGNNPHPCGRHEKKLDDLDNKLDRLGERVSRIEGILNGKR